MSNQRFDMITRGLHFTSKTPPKCNEWIWEAHKMIVAWANTMLLCLFPVGFFAWTKACPFAIAFYMLKPNLLPQEANTLWNEYHTVSCAKNGILNQIESIKDEDCPKAMEEPNLTMKAGMLASVLFVGAILYFLPLCCAWFWLLCFEMNCGTGKWGIVAGAKIKKTLILSQVWQLTWTSTISRLAYVIQFLEW